MDMSRYPVDWKEISWRVRFVRDKGVCQGCGLKHRDLILRSAVEPSRWLRLDEDTHIHYDMKGNSIRLSELPEEFADATYSRVILTVHHVGALKDDGTPGDRHDKMDCRDVNLTSLCQRCHFIADLDIHIIHARASRLAKKQQRILAAGQQSLFASPASEGAGS